MLRHNVVGASERVKKVRRHFAGQNETLSACAKLPLLMKDSFRPMSAVVLLVSAFALVAWADETGQSIASYVVNVGARTATIAWVTQDTGLLLGTDPDNLSRRSTTLRTQTITYTDLTPGTTYYYRTAGASTLAKFKTAPVATTSFRFVVYGDTRSRHEIHETVARAIAKAEPDFVLHTGDLVADGRDSAQWEKFFTIEAPLLANTVFYPSLGNHERNDPHYYQFFEQRLPYYSFDWGQVHIAIVDTDMRNFAATDEARDKEWKEQTAWLDSDLLKSQKSVFRFVMFHHPVFTAVGSRQNEKSISADLVPILERGRVQAVFSGHDHNYQHHEKNGIRYIVTGGGGAPLYEVDKPIPDITKKVEKREHYLQVRVAPDRATVEAIGLDGVVFDTIVIQAPAPMSD